MVTATSHKQAVDFLVPKFFLYPAGSWTGPPGPSQTPQAPANTWTSIETSEPKAGAPACSLTSLRPVVRLNQVEKKF